MTKAPLCLFSYCSSQSTVSLCIHYTTELFSFFNNQHYVIRTTDLLLLYFAYTIDGGAPGELEYENFNAAKAIVQVHGRNVHPGHAKNKMINSILLAQEFISLLPPRETPAHTEGYEGFYHLNDIRGGRRRNNPSLYHPRF